jgi:hypothetical protein
MWPAPTTRVDCLFTVGVHARALTFPTKDLFNTAMRCLIFMGQTIDDGILFSSHASMAGTLQAYGDSDWAVRRSTTGSALQLAGGCVKAVSRRQDCVASSSTHAEIISTSSTANDLIWGVDYLAELGLPQPHPPVLHVDAANVVTISHDFTSSNKTRHITRRQLIVREYVQAGRIRLGKVASAENLADLFTKVLDRVPFERLRKLVMQILRVGATVVRVKRCASN